MSGVTRSSVVPDLSGRPELVGGELGVEGVDHPGGEVVDEEGEDCGEPLLAGETALRDGVEMRPVDDRSNEGEPFGEERDVPESAEGARLPGRLQAEPHPQMFDLGGEGCEPFGDEDVEFVAGESVTRARVGDDDPGSQGRP